MKIIDIDLFDFVKVKTIHVGQYISGLSIFSHQVGLSLSSMMHVHQAKYYVEYCGSSFFFLAFY